MSEQLSNIPTVETVGISPGVGILSIFRYIKYKPWFALAEYVDNAVDSYLKNKQALDDTYWGYQLMIDIELNVEENYIRISDNAAGISGKDLERALRMAVRPPDRSGLSEFGMGMKAASCWFSPKWSVETQALGDDVKRKIVFDVQRIVEEDTSALSTNPSPSVMGHHFTNLYLGDVYSMPSPHAVAKIREHLTSIYRDFLREDKFFDAIVITVNGKRLKYKAPSALVAPPHNDKTAEPIKWRKELDFTCAGGQRVTGFAAIYSTAKTKEAGFALLRRGRVVEGSYDEPYRPAKIFGAPGSFYSQRIYGELHIDDFTASFTKDGVQWEDGEDDFLNCLKAALKAPGIDLLKQANGMRVKELAGGKDGGQDEKSGKGGQPGGEDDTANGGKTTGHQPNPAPSGSEEKKEGAAPQPPDSSNGDNSKPTGKADVSAKGSQPKITEVHTLSATIDGISWRVYLELSHNPAHTDWMTISKSCIPEGSPTNANERLLGVRVSLNHPFTIKYCGIEPLQLAPILRLGAAFALAKTLAQEGGSAHSSVLMDYVNELLLKL
ncbi:ATP-binding protein [Hymenobacter mucosus]|uniref:Histidine kinase-, DNA gyrase B-, and HSP90-like ATPase n=1 Tax=Hymenobacter mucosus TaxID=1411120 RepID=A0A238X300_9BACT|nr:ATP-binding protein [Hymenobacter mucosus]SNR53060.1 Histidine kinase-, DNA gyrase B-, and HSP90-like ATPase [Hymenobacter mucosus]